MEHGIITSLTARLLILLSFGLNISGRSAEERSATHRPHRSKAIHVPENLDLMRHSDGTLDYLWVTTASNNDSLCAYFRDKSDREKPPRGVLYGVSLVAEEGQATWKVLPSGLRALPLNMDRVWTVPRWDSPRTLLNSVFMIPSLDSMFTDIPHGADCGSVLSTDPNRLTYVPSQRFEYVTTQYPDKVPIFMLGEGEEVLLSSEAHGLEEIVGWFTGQRLIVSGWRVMDSQEHEAGAEATPAVRTSSGSVLTTQLWNVPQNELVAEWQAEVSLSRLAEATAYRPVLLGTDTMAYICGHNEWQIADIGNGKLVRTLGIKGDTCDEIDLSSLRPLVDANGEITDVLLIGWDLPEGGLVALEVLDVKTGRRKGYRRVHSPGDRFPVVLVSEHAGEPIVVVVQQEEGHARAVVYRGGGLEESGTFTVPPALPQGYTMAGTNIVLIYKSEILLYDVQKEATYDD